MGFLSALSCSSSSKSVAMTATSKEVISKQKEVDRLTEKKNSIESDPNISQDKKAKAQTLHRKASLELLVLKEDEKEELIMEKMREVKKEMEEISQEYNPNEYNALQEKKNGLVKEWEDCLEAKGKLNVELAETKRAQKNSISRPNN